MSFKFKCNIPSFYCNYCDNNLCQKRLGKNKLNQIQKYNVTLSNVSNNLDDKKSNYDWQIKFLKYIHLLSLIKRSNNFIFGHTKIVKKNIMKKFILTINLYAIMIYMRNVLKKQKSPYS